MEFNMRDKVFNIMGKFNFLACLSGFWAVLFWTLVYFCTLFASVSDYNYLFKYAFDRTLVGNIILMLLLYLPFRYVAFLSSFSKNKLLKFFCLLIPDVLLAIPVLMSIGLAVGYHSPFSPNYVPFILGTNMSEAWEFVTLFAELNWKIYVPIVFVVFVLRIGGYICGKRIIKHHLNDIAQVKRALVLGVLAPVVLMFVIGYQIYDYHFIQDCTRYTAYFKADYATNMYGEIIRLMLTAKTLEDRISYIRTLPMTYDRTIEALNNNDVKETYVLVIGESASRAHWGAYGLYPRDTTPFVSKIMQGGLDDSSWFYFLHPDMKSSALSTYINLHCMLTLQIPIQCQDYDLDAIPLTFVASRAGFDVWWLSNNNTFAAVDAFNQWFYSEAKHVYVVPTNINEINSVSTGMSSDMKSLVFDDKLLQPFENALKSDAPKKFIILHLKGSHFRYDRRYPQHMEKWKTDAITPAEEIRPDLFNSLARNNLLEYRAQVNSYDNSLRYTDYILEQIWNLMRAYSHDGPQWMLYLSDHGEDVGDQLSISESIISRSFVSPTFSMINIPMFMISNRSILDFSNSVKSMTYMPLFLTKQLGISADIIGRDYGNAIVTGMDITDALTLIPFKKFKTSPFPWAKK